MYGPISIIDKGAPQPTDLLNNESLLHLLSASDYDDMNPEGLRLWCHHNARYGLPTKELIWWLKSEIADRLAVEIGAGCGDLCHHLGIIGTDNLMQTWPEVQTFYDATGQPTIKYGKHVEGFPAHSAIRLYQPQVVVASWVTQWCDETLPPPKGGGNPHGVREDDIILDGITYILIGNLGVHGKKEIMDLPHECLDLPFVRSRSASQQLNRVWIWNR